GKIAKDVFAAMVDDPASPAAIVDRRGLAQIEDPETLGPIIDRILADHPVQAAQYRAGQTRVLGYFVGQVMKATRGQASPELANRLLRQALAGD
ncbi:MAG: Asp-tRNA(Asn)/Glu-tRNA(Gln) amidotransferase GatCAB subunit B, partial [Acidobacteriota bacterium]